MPISEEEPAATVEAFELRRVHDESVADDSAQPLPGGGIGPDHPASGTPFKPTDCPPACEGSGHPR